jgi:hypothetical protein
MGLHIKLFRYRIEFYHTHTYLRATRIAVFVFPKGRQQLAYVVGTFGTDEKRKTLHVYFENYDNEEINLE